MFSADTTNQNPTTTATTTPDAIHILPLSLIPLQLKGLQKLSLIKNARLETVVEMYRTDDHNQFLEVTYQNGDKEVLYFKDFASGAMIENIVRRAKKLAIKRTLAGGTKGVAVDDLVSSIKQEYKEHEDLPNTTNPDDWAKISGKKGERIVFIRTLVSGRDAAEGGRAIERAATGQYL